MSLVLDAGIWPAVMAVVTLFGLLLLHRRERRKHTLNLLRAAPRIGTDVKLERRVVGNQVFRYFVCTKIYNEGELAASKLEGNWELTCSEPGQERTRTISKDFLGIAAPYDLEAEELRGASITNTIRGGQQISINVHVEFEYVGLPEDEAQKYSADYEYNPKQRQFERE